MSYLLYILTFSEQLSLWDSCASFASAVLQIMQPSPSKATLFTMTKLKIKEGSKCNLYLSERKRERKTTLKVRSKVPQGRTIQSGQWSLMLECTSRKTRFSEQATQLLYRPGVSNIRPKGQRWPSEALYLVLRLSQTPPSTALSCCLTAERVAHVILDSLISWKYQDLYFFCVSSQ